MHHRAPQADSGTVQVESHSLVLRVSSLGRRSRSCRCLLRPNHHKGKSNYRKHMDVVLFGYQHHCTRSGVEAF
jgi:hypothetical protein